ncbi:hypothetical protein QQS21_010053 [Conoideocrella luteorostrata]|uniref:Pyridoxamine 5'-phosphate oxidase Alr4036 family FMN-binding domain-containing protein n=1 Tax=Conoideocrella luteorostrata TaxID=1105319 RepID=A0AAJ0CIG1_9HYPO|nr:hypothetical protein QQS21_010053 [Conoideocrella luteorostrata]
MSSQPKIPAAPWRDPFVSDMQSMKSPTFTLSSLHQVSPASQSTQSPQFVPRARTVVYRGMWASLPPNSKNPASLNPNSYDTELPTITTDARMEKVSEMFPTGSKSSSMGGPIEAVFWATESMTQWRLKGRIFMIGPDIDSEQAASVRNALTPHMRKVGDIGPWSWSRELTAHFGNLNPLMRGTFRNPPPGTPITQAPEQGYVLGREVEDLEDAIARKNFRVLVIVPEDVDRVDLSNPKKGQRWNYKLNGGMSWEETELWP